MGATLRVIALSLIVTLLLGGPLAPLAHAQSPRPMATTPGGSPAPGAAPGSAAGAPDQWRAAYKAGAVVADVFYVPGKGILCGVGVTFGMILLLATFGSGYRAASSMAHEGCGGQWLVNADDLRPEREESRAFEWETHRFEWEPPLEQTSTR